MFEERSGHSSDLPSVGASGGCAHPGCLPCLLSHGDAEVPAPAACSGINAPCSAGETRCHSNAGCVFPDYRWPPLGHAALHRAEPRAGASPPPTEARPPTATAPTHHRCCLIRSLSSTPNVVGDLVGATAENKGYSGFKSAELRRLG